MKFKTKNLTVDDLHSIGENIGLLSIGERSFQVDKRLFDLLFEPLEEESEKQETYVCHACINEFAVSLLEITGTSFCKKCLETLKIIEKDR